MKDDTTVIITPPQVISTPPATVTITPPLESLRVNWVPQEILDLVRANIPIATVDFVVYRENQKRSGARPEFLLIKRSDNPTDHWRNVWWFHGGMQKRGESEAGALVRLTEREIGLVTNQVLHYHFRFNMDVYNPGSLPDAEKVFPAHHSKMAIYAIHVKESFEPRLDKQSKTPTWFDEHSYPENLPEPVRLVLSRLNLIL